MRNSVGTSRGSLLPGGHGVLGMRERAATYGGRCEAGPVAGGYFEVHAVLPLDARAQEPAR